MANFGALKNSLQQNSSVPISHVLKTWHLTSVIFLLVVVVLSCHLPQTEAKSVGVCNGITCANGGRLLVSNSVWGNCKCRCPSGFVGPYCQYEAARKPSAPRLASSKPFRSETMEKIRQRLELMRLLYEARLEMDANEVINDPVNAEDPAADRSMPLSNEEEDLQDTQTDLNRIESHLKRIENLILYLLNKTGKK